MYLTLTYLGVLMATLAFLAYFAVAVIISFDLGFSWLSGSLLIGSICGFFAGSGAKGMWHSGQPFLGFFLGGLVLGIGVFVINSSGVTLHLASVNLSGELWVVFGFVWFFLTTTKKDTFAHETAPNTAPPTANDSAPAPPTAQNSNTDSQDDLQRRADEFSDKVAKAYLQIWSDLAPNGVDVYDELRLPTEKDTLISALKYWLQQSSDPVVKELWAMPFEDISLFQPNVGKDSKGLGNVDFSSTDNIEELAKSIRNSALPKELKDAVVKERKTLSDWYLTNIG